MSSRIRSWMVALVIGLVVAGLAILLRTTLTPIWGTRFVFTFAFPAVIVAAWYGGLTAGLAATLVLTASSTWFLAPGELFALNDSADVLAVVVFSLFGCAVSLIVHRLQTQVGISARLADELQLAEAQRRSALESIQDGFFAVDRDWNFTYANARTLELVGLSAASLCGRNLWRTFPQSVATPLEACYRRVAATGVSEQVQNYADPTGRWYDVRVYPAAQGGISVLLEDITERRRVSGELRDFRATLEAIVEGTDDLMYAKDEQGRIILANGAVLKLLRRAREDVIGRTLPEIVADPDFVRSAAESEQRVMRMRRTETSEDTIATPIGARTYLVTRSPRFDAQGNVIGIIGVGTDITARKRTEIDLRDAHDELAREVSERTAELVELSHHLLRVTENEKAKLARELHDALGGTLTTLVLGVARLKLRFAAAAPEQETSIAQVESTVHEIVAMTRRIIGGLRPVTLETLGLAATLQDHVEKWSRSTGVEVKLSVASELPPLSSDAALVAFRIVQEALTNVAKHAYATDVEVSVAQAPGRLEIAIEDNGVGIPAAAARRPRSHGLLGMRERAAGCGGTLVIGPGAHGRGTRVELAVPINPGTPERRAGGSLIDDASA